MICRGEEGRSGDVTYLIMIVSVWPTSVTWLVIYKPIQRRSCLPITPFGMRPRRKDGTERQDLRGTPGLEFNPPPPHPFTRPPTTRLTKKERPVRKGHCQDATASSVCNDSGSPAATAPTRVHPQRPLCEHNSAGRKPCGSPEIGPKAWTEIICQVPRAASR